MTIKLSLKAYNWHFCKVHPIWENLSLVGFCETKIVFGSCYRGYPHTVPDKEKDILGLVFIYFGIVFANRTIGIIHLNIFTTSRFLCLIHILDCFCIQFEVALTTTSSK